MKQPIEGERVGQYRLSSRLGEGGLGEVWKAVHVELEREVVAIKFPRRPEVVEALRAQGVAQNPVRHPNVVRVTNMDLDSDPPYLVMEYVEGESLAVRLAREGRLATDEAVRIVRQVLLALVAAHKAGRAHGDLKPSNILLCGDGRVRLTDFASGAAPPEADLARSQPSGEPVPWQVQSWAYASPEQRRGASPTALADLYSLGLLFYEMVTGAAGRMRFPIRGIPSRLSSVIERATEDDPAARFPDAARMLRELRRHRSNPPGTPNEMEYHTAGDEESTPSCACGRVVPAGARYCSGCGRALEIACGRCGRVNPVSNEACDRCGADLSEEGVQQARARLSSSVRYERVVRIRVCDACHAENAAESLTCRRCAKDLSNVDVREVPAWKRLLPALTLLAGALPLLALGVAGTPSFSIMGAALCVCGMACTAFRGGQVAPPVMKAESPSVGSDLS